MFNRDTADLIEFSHEEIRKFNLEGFGVKLHIIPTGKFREVSTVDILHCFNPNQNVISKICCANAR